MMSAPVVVLAIALGLGAAAALFALRCVWARTPFDRLLAAHAVWTVAALIAAALSVILAAPPLLDAALALVLVDAVLAIAAIKALRRTGFQPALAPLDEAAP